MKQKIGNEGPEFSINSPPKLYKKDAPGPGSYSPDEKKVILKKPVFTVPKNMRIMTSPANRYAVGPGTHGH